MNEFESLATTMQALQKEKQRQETTALERIKETNKAEYLRQKRERQIQRQQWQWRQRQISNNQRQQRRIAELEATKTLYENEVQRLSILAQSAQGLEVQQLQLMAQKRQLEIMEIEQELTGVQSQGSSWLRTQIQQIDNRLEMLEDVLQTQEQIQLESQLKQIEEEELREEAERLVNLKQELEQKYPPEVVDDILIRVSG